MNIDALLSYSSGQDRFSAKKTGQDFDEKLLAFRREVRHGEEQGLLAYMAKREQMPDVKRYQDASFWKNVAQNILKNQLKFEQLV